MRLKSIRIENLAAFPSLSAMLPAVSLLQGANGVGKTSLKAVICYAFGRRAEGSRSVEHDPRMLHGNAEKGEATITFDDDSQLRVLVTRDSTTRMTKPKDGKRWSKTGAEIDALANALSYDPIQFKTFDEKRRVETLLKVMPATVTAEEIQAAVGDVAVGVPHAPGLEAINAYYDDIYALRRTENVAADTQLKHAKELEAAIPDSPDSESWATVAARLEGERRLLNDSGRAFIAAAEKAMNAVKDESGARHQERVEASLRLMNQEVDAARVECAAAISAKRDELGPEISRLTAEIATANERSQQQARSQGALEAAKKARAEAENRQMESRKMTEALDRLNELKASVAARLPIKGIVIAAAKPGLPVDICREENGALIPFSAWNDTSKLLFCLRVALLSHGQCGLVCVDSIDAIDPETREKFIGTCRKYAEQSKMQFLLGEVTGGPLRITELTDTEDK